jgi:hypothetical protein
VLSAFASSSHSQIFKKKTGDISAISHAEYSVFSSEMVKNNEKQVILTHQT